MKKLITMISMGLGLIFVLSACSSTRILPAAPSDDGEAVSSLQPPADPIATSGPDDIDDYRIVTLLPRDAIPAIDDPQFLDSEAANREYTPDEEVLGVVFDGEARAYSVPLLSGHEIVNDTVAGRKIAVTW